MDGRRRVELECRTQVVADICQAQKDGCRVSKACEVIGISKRTFERWNLNPLGDLRKGPKTTPKNKLTEEEKSKILKVVKSKEYYDKPPGYIVASLADKGSYIASESSFYRVLKDSKLLVHRGKSKPRMIARPKELIARKANQVFSWDITYIPTNIRGVFYYLYLFMDVYSRKIVGYSVEHEQSSKLASKLLIDIYKKEHIVAGQVTLHSDNGKPMKGATMLATFQSLGIIPSFSRPSVSNDNPYSESMFKTLKYCPQYPSKPFESIEASRSWVDQFVHWYNNEHFHSSIKYVTPQMRHEGKDKAILANRELVYEKAKTENPSRWSGHTRNWDHVEEVYLNKLNRNDSSCRKKAA